MHECVRVRKFIMWVDRVYRAPVSVYTLQSLVNTLDHAENVLGVTLSPTRARGVVTLSPRRARVVVQGCMCMHGETILTCSCPRHGSQASTDPAMAPPMKPDFQARFSEFKR